MTWISVTTYKNVVKMIINLKQTFLSRMTTHTFTGGSYIKILAPFRKMNVFVLHGSKIPCVLYKTLQEGIGAYESKKEVKNVIGKIYYVYEDPFINLGGLTGYLVKMTFNTVKLQSNVITKTCLYNFDPFKPHFYKVKLGFTWGIISYFCS